MSAVTTLCRQAMKKSTVFAYEIASIQESCAFVKKLLAVALSNITYLRVVFPDHAYANRCIDGEMDIKMLKEKSSCPGASEFVGWMRGCFDALEKQYLRQIVVGVYNDPNDPETVLESYSFKISYNENGTTNMDLFYNDTQLDKQQASNELKKSVKLMLRTLVVMMQALQPLPENMYLNMKLHFYDECTPTEYEPPGFRSSDQEFFHYRTNPMNVKIGDVKTIFHSIKVRVKVNDAMLKSENECHIKVTKQSADTLNEYEDPPTQYRELKQGGTVTTGIDVQPVPLVSETASIPPVTDESAGPIDNSTADNEDAYSVRCPCARTQDFGIMILCCECGFWQHGPCFGFMSVSEVPQYTVCNICCQLPGTDIKPTDDTHIGLSDTDLQGLCLWRHALAVCSGMKSVIMTKLARRLHIETSVAQVLYTRMSEEGFFKMEKTKGLVKHIDAEKLQEGLKKYLPQGNRRVTQEEDQTKSDSPPQPVNEPVAQPSPVNNTENDTQPITTTTTTKTPTLFNRLTRASSRKRNTEVEDLINDADQLAISKSPPKKKEGKSTVKNIATKRGLKKTLLSNNKNNEIIVVEQSDSQEPLRSQDDFCINKNYPAKRRCKVSHPSTAIPTLR